MAKNAPERAILKANGHVLFRQGRTEIALERGGVLRAAEWGKYCCQSEHSGDPREWSLWRHEHGFVVCPDLTAWGADRFAIKGDPLALLEIGVQDCRRRHSQAVDRLVALTQAGQQDGVVPFIVADDSYDAYEALAAAKAFFYTPMSDEFDLKFPLVSTNIPEWHDNRMVYQADGSFDVAAGMWHRPLDAGESHEDWIEDVGDCFTKERGTKCIVIANADNLGRAGTTISGNFGSLIDSAVCRVRAWGCSAAAIGTWDAWLALVRAPNGPLRHPYELVHLPAAASLDPGFASLMMSKFRRECSYVFEGTASAGAEMSPELAEAIWTAARHRKDLALAMIEAVVADSAQLGFPQVDVSSVRGLVADGCRRGR